MTDEPREDCLFCRIYAGEIPADTVAEGEDWMAFRDIDPQAPVHVLIIPKRHVESVAALETGDTALAGRLLLAAAETARELGVEEDGYRLVTNRGEKAGQSVFHLHLHLLAGRRMNWPPG
ncbi:MAG: histidine triad nucleotide-binding protein [Gemmatimonadales bacterium]